MDSAADKQGDDISRALEQTHSLGVRQSIQTQSVHCQQHVATLQSAVSSCWSVSEHVLDDDGEVAAVTAVAADDCEAEALSNAPQSDLRQRFTESATVHIQSYIDIKQTLCLRASEMC